MSDSHSTPAADPKALAASDGLSRTIFVLAALGAIAFFGLVYFFVLGVTP